MSVMVKFHRPNTRHTLKDVEPGSFFSFANDPFDTFNLFIMAESASNHFVYFDLDGCVHNNPKDDDRRKVVIHTAKIELC